MGHGRRLMLVADIGMENHIMSHEVKTENCLFQLMAKHITLTNMAM